MQPMPVTDRSAPNEEQPQEPPITHDQDRNRRQHMLQQAQIWQTEAKDKAQQASGDERLWNWFDWLFTVGAAAAAGSGGSALSGHTAVTVALGFTAAITTAAGAVAKRWAGVARDTTYTWRQVVPRLEVFVNVIAPPDNGYPISTVESEFKALFDGETTALKSVAAEGKDGRTG